MPGEAPRAQIHRFTVDQYHTLIAKGILTTADRVELLEGYVVQKWPNDPPHDGTLQLVEDAVRRFPTTGLCGRVKMAVTLAQSEPEPDFVLARGSVGSYLTHHPAAADVVLLVEVATASVATDREFKLPIYAAAGVAVYWIVNVVERQIEVFEAPSGDAYAKSKIFRPGDTVPISVDGVAVGTIPVVELLA